MYALTLRQRSPSSAAAFSHTGTLFSLKMLVGYFLPLLGARIDVNLPRSLRICSFRQTLKS